MSANRDFDQLLRTWLEGGSTQLSDRVLDAVLDQLPQVRQHRHGRWRWLPSPQQRPMLFAVAGAAAAAALVLGIGLFGRNVGDPPDPPPPVPSAAPSVVPVLPGGTNLDGGRYRLWPRAELSVTVEVPDGWDSHERWAIMVPGQWPGSMGLAFWNPVNLYNDPLLSARVPMDPPVGPTVEDFAQALAAHAGWDAEAPRPVTVDGHDGLMVRLLIPSESEITECRAFRLWYDVSDGRYRCVRAPGAVIDVYIVDVRGERVVFDAQFDPGASSEEVATLQRMTESIRFDPAP